MRRGTLVVEALSMLQRRLGFVVALILVRSWAQSVHAQVGEAWLSTYDGPAAADDLPRAMAVDSEGNVYVTGRSLTGRLFENSWGGGPEGDFATVKWGADGRRLWAARFDGSGGEAVDDEAVAIALGVDRQVH